MKSSDKIRKTANETVNLSRPKKGEKGKWTKFRARGRKGNDGDIDVSQKRK